ncbi:hypothetical protein AMTRI_Chr10g229110 [Amborella trichopoda]
MWLQKVYYRSVYLYCQSACLYCRSNLFNRRSAVAPEGVLLDYVFVLPERMSPLLERPIQPSECYGSRRCIVGASPCIAGVHVIIAEAFKWTAEVHGERVMGKSHEEREGGSLVFSFFCFGLGVFVRKDGCGEKSERKD